MALQNAGLRMTSPYTPPNTAAETKRAFIVQEWNKKQTRRHQTG